MLHANEESQLNQALIIGDINDIEVKREEGEESKSIKVERLSDALQSVKTIKNSANDVKETALSTVVKKSESAHKMSQLSSEEEKSADRVV